MYSTNFDLSIDADPNRNYDILEHAITSAINKHLPTKTIKFNKHKHTKSNWITQGIIKSIKYRDMLYRKLKKTNPYCQQHEIMVINLHYILTKDKTIIANGFNTYFANNGYNLASKMKNNSNTAYDDFLSNHSLSSFTFHSITEETTINIIL